MAPFNKLPVEFLDLNEMGTQSRGVSVLYGRRDDGSLVAVNVADDGTINTNTSVTVDPVGVASEATLEAINTKLVSTPAGIEAYATPKGSSSSFFTDQVATPLSAVAGTWTHLTFGFTSFNITIINDDGTHQVEYSFDGSNVHGRCAVGEGYSMDYRAQAGVWLRAVGGGATTKYRAFAY